MTALAVAISLLGVLLTLIGAVYLVRSTRHLRARGTPERTPGLVALEALLSPRSLSASL